MLELLRNFTQFAFIPVYFILTGIIFFKAVKEKEVVSLFLIFTQVLVAVSIYCSTIQVDWQNIWFDYVMFYPLILLYLFHGLHLCKLNRVLRAGILLFFGLVGFFHYLPSFKYDLSNRIIRSKAEFIMNKKGVADVYIVPQHPFTNAIGSYYGGNTWGNKIITIDNPFHNQEYRKLIGLESEVNGINLVFVDRDSDEERISKNLEGLFGIHFYKKDYQFFDVDFYSHPYGKRRSVKINSFFFLKK